MKNILGHNNCPLLNALGDFISEKQKRERDGQREKEKETDGQSLRKSEMDREQYGILQRETD